MNIYALKPQHIVCCIHTYLGHAKESMGPEATGHPIPMFALKSPKAICHDRDPVVLPDVGRLAVSDDPWGWVTGEVELGLVVGRRAYRVPASRFNAHISGCTIVNDVTQRDMQRHLGAPHSMAKSFPTFAPIGPRVVPLNRIKDIHNLEMDMLIDGKQVQSANTRELIFTPEELFEAVNAIIPLRKGDIIATGTPFGALSYRLKPGNLMEASISEIGKLRNPTIFKGRLRAQKAQT